MTGSNELILCPHELCLAVQTYLNEHVLQPGHAVKVPKIAHSTCAGSFADNFIVHVEPLVPEKDRE